MVTCLGSPCLFSENSTFAPMPANVEENLAQLADFLIHVRVWEYGTVEAREFADSG